ncbi:MAG: hypothetical protein ACREJG_11835 [Candidatus Rokuibacteriota bacterium]
MLIPRLFAVALIVLLAGCASTPSRSVRSEFEDIPVPRGLSYQAGESVVIESPSVKAARLIYRGRIEPESLGLAMRTTLEANGWRHISTTSNARQGTAQVFEKSGNSLQVLVWEGLWFTYVELTASRALGAAASAAR